MTPFRAALLVCGLDQAEAAEKLGVSEITVNAWSRGVRTPSFEAWNVLASGFAAVDAAAEALRYQIAPSLMDRKDVASVTVDADLAGSGADIAAGIGILRAVLES